MHCIAGGTGQEAIQERGRRIFIKDEMNRIYMERQTEDKEEGFIFINGLMRVRTPAFISRDI